MPIKRMPLRAQVHRTLLHNLVSGRIPAGASIREEALARRVGVSRTPLREALFELERDGFVELQPGRGFFVRPLSSTEAHQVYPMVWALEALAVDLLLDHRAELLPALERANATFAWATTPHDRMRADALWHRRLASASKNLRLTQTLSRLKATIARYELAFQSSTGDAGTSVREHAEIARCIELGDLSGARERLVQHWREGLAILLTRIAEAKT